MLGCQRDGAIASMAMQTVHGGGSMTTMVVKTSYARRLVAAAIMLGGVMAATPARAEFISGSIGWTGAGVLSFSTGGGAPGTNYIDFCPDNVSGPLGCGTNPTGIGTIAVD